MILDLLPDKLVLNLQYFATVGRKLNLKNPERFTEKVQWYKLNYRTPLMTICSDKYLMRNYVADKGYSEFLPSLLGIYDSYNQIDFTSLPNSFALKCNNGSGTNIFIRNKANCDLGVIKKTIDSWSKVNTLSVGREWSYQNIKQKIIVEELLTPEDDFQIENGLNDYKILCFNGNPRYAWVDVKRHTDHRRNFYDLNWMQLNVMTDKPNTDSEVPKPSYFELMLEIASDFAQDFPFVRVDFYCLNNRIYIGELTFYPWSGCVQFIPDSFDFELGKAFKLPFITRSREA
ncbi:MAG: hypothetical protein CVU85_00320 [Firmicutes bacterium HGW-Firmicutes-10]|nr:MAG: hypothetical protein CVU85_00320 [Firmicutes bacterium HGW-Firmicutes-10]